MIVHADRTVSDVLVDEAVDALDGLLPGLGAAVVDLFDAIHDRTDDPGAARSEPLVRLAEHLTRAWPRTAAPDRPLVVLDAVRSVMHSRP
ncbi:hypothetical protein LQ327_29755 [Actinomycetospora endophytica]|uniref:Barstar (Barnase inhibitor) n=1 Tax=Actinomycetospora endophytica TaxID=2291215 RepID=A0ABS8PHP8_9PSEU|nr:hypothetical protein [Actinomycetospora endophytica]MCD2197563.1 hypothetical protein [Actinomycetospora endophytica]